MPGAARRLALAAQLAGVTPETLAHWMKWDGEPYATFQRLVRKAEADLEDTDGDGPHEPGCSTTGAGAGDPALISSGGNPKGIRMVVGHGLFFHIPGIALRR